MQNITIFELNKWKESPETFEKRVNAWIQTTGDVILLSASENVYNGDIVLVLKSSGEKKSIVQELCLIAWSDLKTLESAVNNALPGIEESGRCAKFINFVTTSKSARGLAVFIVEGNRLDLTNYEPEQSTTNADRPENSQEKKQDEAANVKTKRGRKKKSLD